MERYDSEFKVDARKELEGNTRITSGKDGLIVVEVDDHEAAFSAQIANAYVEELGNLLKRMTITEAQQRRAFFERQLAQTKEKLNLAEQALKASGVNNSVLKLNGAAVLAVAQLQAQITGQEVKLASMRGYLADSAPEFRQAQNELSVFRAQLLKADNPANAFPAADADYLSRFRDVKYQESLFELYARQFEIAKLDESRESVVNQVVDFAQPPERKSKPKKALVAVLSVLGAGFALLLFVFVRQAWRGAAAKPQTAAKLAALRAAVRRAKG
jgi:uncharacterized protein involved in exopolysaccharide biosynthesis